MFGKLMKSLGLKSAPPSLPLEDRPTEPIASPVVDVTDADFAGIIGAGPALAVVDFWADWCAPCETMSAYVGFLAEDFAGRILVVALDVDENPTTAEQFGVMGLPTLLFLRNGQEVGRQVGLLPYDELKLQVENFLTA